MCGLMAALVASLLSSSPGGLEILTIDTGDSWANSTISAIPGHNVTTITAAGIGGIDFNLFDVLYVTDAFSNSSTPTWASELNARGPDIETYINGGGFVIVGVAAFSGPGRTNGDEYNFLPSGLVDGQPIGTQINGNDVVITDPVHPLFDGITSADLSNWASSYHGALPVGTLPVLATNAGGQVLVRAGDVGAGGVFVWSLDPDYHHFFDDIPGTLALVENAIALVVARPPAADRTLIIKQGACPAPVNPASRGLTPMLLVGEEDFDVSQVDLSSLELTRCDGVGDAVAPHSGPPGPGTRIVDLNHPNLDEVGCGADQVPCACNEDQSSDGIDDLQLKFDTSDMAEAFMLDGEPSGSIITLFLSGDLTDGTRFVAADCIRTVGPPVPPGMLLVGATVPDVWVGATPLDLIFDGGGFASFERAYPRGSVVELTAPATYNGWTFSGWDINGLPVDNLGPTALIIVTDETTTAFVRYQRIGDLNGDGVVGIPDPLALLGAWGPCLSCSDCPADVDGDCQVGVTDLLILLANWGP